MLLSSFAAVLFDWHTRSWGLVAFVLLLLGLAAFALWTRPKVRDKNEPFMDRYKPEIGASIFALLAIVNAADFAKNIVAVNIAVNGGATRAVEGIVQHYRLVDDGKGVRFDVGGVTLSGFCCDSRPVFWVPKNDAPHVVHDGMHVRVTYVHPDAVIKIESIP